MHPHVRLMEKWFDEVWSKENADAIDEMFSSCGEASGLGERPIVGPAEFREFHSALLRLIRDVSIRIDDHICDGKKCSLVCTVKGTCRKSGNPVEMSGSCFITIEDGKICGCENHFEFIALYEQLGLLPGNTFQKALSGEKIV